MNEWYGGKLYVVTTYSLHSDGALKADYDILTEDATYLESGGRIEPYRNFFYIHWLPLDAKAISAPCTPQGCFVSDNQVQRLNSSEFTMKLKRSKRNFSVIFPRWATSGITPNRIKRKDSEGGKNIIMSLGYDGAVIPSGKAMQVLRLRRVAGARPSIVKPEWSPARASSRKLSRFPTRVARYPTAKPSQNIS